MPGLLSFTVLLLSILDRAYSTRPQNDHSIVKPSASEQVGSQSLTLRVPGVSQAATDHATCSSRTANYITHTLPQQCLRTNRAFTATTNTTNEPSTTDVSAFTSPSDASRGANTTESYATTVGTTRSPEKDTHSQSNTISTGAEPDKITTSSSTAATAQETDLDSDSPLDNANFLSFEDWKRQNLVKAGQSPENLGPRSHAPDGERKRPGINNALDTLGEESEIELDFSGFGASHGNPAHERSSSGTDDSAKPPSSLTPQSSRSKDAGKTCKERTNYASFDCAATILKNNPESKSGSSVLVENKDSYMLNKCSARNKFVIIELCSDILIDTIVLANYEFFSSIFRHFRVSVSDRYPVKMDKWKDLGTFEARNTREMQAFLIENPLIWARYLRIEFLTHYGNEYYCPVSLLRVHGTTMMDEFRHQEEIARGDIQDDEIAVEPDVPAQTTMQQEPLAESPEAVKSTIQAVSNTEMISSETTPEPRPSFVNQSAPVDSSDEGLDKCLADTNTLRFFNQTTQVYSTCAIDEQSSNLRSEAAAPDLSKHVPKQAEGSSTPITHASAIGTESNPTKRATTSSENPGRSDSSAASRKSTTSTTSNVSEQDKVAGTIQSNQVPSSSTRSTVAVPPNSHLQIETSTTKHGPPATNSTRQPSGSTNVPPPQPSTQESFFKSVHKRLQQLESNSTLSLQYIEEQSRILRDAFSKVEKRQVTSTTNFLSHLNSTVMGELQGFRQAYDQLWQSTVIELEGQREQYQREMLALSTRLTLVADELVWQKRMGIVQSTLLLLCLALVLFNRTGNSALEMPLLQHMTNKSQAALRAGWESPTGSRSPDNHSPENRSPENRSPVSLFRKRLWRHSTDPVSGHATDYTDSRPQSRDATHTTPDVTLDPPTPPSGETDSEDEGDWKEVPEVPEVQSGPATPTGTREALGSPPWVEDNVRPSSSLT